VVQGKDIPTYLLHHQQVSLISRFLQPCWELWPQVGGKDLGCSELPRGHVPGTGGFGLQLLLPSYQKIILLV